MGGFRSRAAGLVLVALLAGCAQPAVSATTPAPPGPPPATALADAPSEQAEMVCSAEAQADIQGMLGVTPAAVGPLAYADHVATCRYAYANGSFTVTVQDLPDDITTTRAYDAFAAKRGRVEKLPLLDAEGFTTTEGSIVLRRDTKVMLVDVTALPSTFGEPPIPRTDAARLVTRAVLDCWIG